MKIISLILNHLENILKFNLDVINIVCNVALINNLKNQTNEQIKHKVSYLW